MSDEPEIFTEPVTVNVLPFFNCKSILALSSTTISEKVAPADPLNIMDPLRGSIIISLLYATSYKYLLDRF